MPRLTLFLLVCCCVLLLPGCGGGSKVQKNRFGAPRLDAGGGPGTPQALAVPAHLLPPGAEPMETATGVSDRNFTIKQAPAQVQEFFRSALKGAKFETRRAGDEIEVTGGGWVIIILGGGEGEDKFSTLVYATTRELGR